MSNRPGPPSRGDFAVWRQATTRWADDDAYGHLNNARYYELFDTAVNAHLFEATGTNIRRYARVGHGCRVTGQRFSTSQADC